MINPNPGCKKDCRFIFFGASTTCMGWTQSWDKHGNLVGQDPNITKETVKCLTCDKQWYLKTQYGKTKIEASKYNVD